MPTRGSQWVRFFLCCLGVALAAGCGGSVAHDAGGAAGGGSAGADAGGTAGTGGSAGGCDYQGQHYAEGQGWSNGCSSCTCSAGQPACGLDLCGCDYGGVFHAVGSSFPASDGCNTCTCQSSGQAVCTEIACASGCDYAGQQYQVGDSFPALDGCNTCMCSVTGVGCTKIACQCDPANEWWRSYVATDPAFCATAKYACPANTTPFQSSCGCGCEEDKSCPEVVDCLPPAPDCSAQMAKCPFSSVAK